MIRLSTTAYEIEVYKDEECTVPFTELVDMTGLVLIAKKKASDADADAVFVIEQDDMSIDGNKVTFVVTSDMTSGLPKNKETTITLELVKITAPRQTLGAPFPVSVYKTYKDEEEE